MLIRTLPPLADVLAEHGLSGVEETPFPNDGWSGSRLTGLQTGGRKYVLKRTSASFDWIVRATDDTRLREAWVAAGPLHLPPAVVAPYLGVASDGDGAALLMPDLSDVLLRSDRVAVGTLGVDTMDRVLRATADLHAAAWSSPDDDPPWCPLANRLTLLTKPAAEAYAAAGLAVADRFMAGWAAFDRQAPAAARDLVARLSADPSPLLRALDRLPVVGLHGDLKLANVALLGNGGVAVIDWQMTLGAPVAVELGWFLVSNVASLPLRPDAVLERYAVAARSAGVELGDWGAQADLAWLVGLLLRGWRKGLDAEAAVPSGWGAGGPDELAWWCRHAVAAADRRL